MINAEKMQMDLGLDYGKILKDLRLPEVVYERILRMAVASTEQSILTLQGAITSGDMLVIQKIAHELKGVWANLRVTSLQTFASEIDDAAREDKDIEKIKSLHDQFLEKFDMMKKMCS